MISFLPFTYSWLIKKNIDKTQAKKILELGCGKGVFADLVNAQNKYQITGVDIFEPYLKECRLKGKYAEIVKKNLNEKLPFRNKSFDVVVCLQTIEHLKKKRGLSLLEEMEKVAGNLVIVSTPNKGCIQEEYDSNKHQRHLSVWTMNDFTERGYIVYGTGSKLIYGTDSHATNKIELSKIHRYLFSFLMNPIANVYPRTACQLVAIKKLNRKFSR